MEKLLTHKEEPVIPDTLMRARISATVVVLLVIDKNGNVSCPLVISGPQMLQQTTLDAIRKYKYKPYLLNGDPVAVETTVAMVFDLN